MMKSRYFICIVVIISTSLLFINCGGSKKPSLTFTNAKGEAASSNLKLYISTENSSSFNSAEKYIFDEMQSLYGYFQKGNKDDFDIKVVPNFSNYSERQLAKPKTEVQTFGPFKMFVTNISYEVGLEYGIFVYDKKQKQIGKINKNKIATGHGEGVSPRGERSLRRSQKNSSINDAKKDAITKASRKILIDISNSIINSIGVQSYEQHLSAEHQSEDTNLNLLIWTGAYYNEKSEYSEEPFISIKKRIQNKIDAYLMPRSPDDLSHHIPQKVEKPSLPPMPELVKSQFETKEMFEDRIEKTIADRSARINDLQKKYRWEVEKRNSIVEMLSEKHEKQLEEIKEEQKRKKELLPEKLKESTQTSFLETMGRPIFDNPVYDAETETMYMDLKATNANYTKKVSIKVPISKAESFYRNIEKVLATVKFEMKDASITLAKIKAHFDNENYFAEASLNNFQPEYLKVDLLDKKVAFSDTFQKDFLLQNPNLLDTYRVEAIKYEDGVSSKNKNIDDDLTPLIDVFKGKEIDPKKWLFIIAVENYSEADPVQYSSNSAKKFKLAAKKIFGIDDRRIYFLVDENATSGAIKDKLTYLVENVNEGDTVIFYYSGHGVPDPLSQEAYILPKDKVVDFVVRDEDFMLSKIYKKLSDSKADNIIVFIDACFSGKTDNRLIFKGVAPGLMRTKKVRFDENKMVVLTAGKYNQFSNSYDEKGHRMFSYFLIKSLLTRTKADLDTIYKEVSLNVKDTSRNKGDVYLQEPQIYGNTQIKLF